MEDFNLHAAQGKECSVDWIEQAVDCLPMMSERTLVVVTDFDLFKLGDSAKSRLIGILSGLPLAGSGLLAFGALGAALLLARAYLLSPRSRRPYAYC